MTQPDLNGPAKTRQPFLITAFVEEGFAHVDFTVIAQGRTKGGLTLGRHPVPAQMGIALDAVVTLFVQACQSGLIGQMTVVGETTNEAGETIPRFQLDDEGRTIVGPVTGHFVLVPPQPTPPEAPPEPPPSRIVTL